MIMLLEKINEEELEFYEDFLNPIALIECLFGDFDNLGQFTETLGHVRLYQFSIVSYEYFIDDNPNISAKENFKLREGAGNLFCFGGRKYGKTLIVEILDMLTSMVHLDGENVGFSSYDALHIRGVLEKVVQILELHPFYDLFLKPKINRSPNYHFYLKTGYTLDSVNMNLQSKSPGSQFFQKHFDRLYIEEASFETEEVNKKRIDAIAENGCVQRLAGMTNFTKYSPVGQIYYNPYNKPWISNYPQYVNPVWGEQEKAKSIREHGGENSLSYRVFVKGEVVEEGIAVFDMERVRQNYNEEKQVKHFEVNKENFSVFTQKVIVERPPQAEACFVNADIGETAPTEITILFKIKDKYFYEYNITCYNLPDKEQTQLFLYLADQLKVDYIGIDTTDGMGRAIFRALVEKLGTDKMVWVGFNEKIKVDFDRDDQNNIVFENGQPVYKEEYVSDWSVKRLKDLLYEQKFILPLDYKLDIQLNSVVSMVSGTRTVYECVSEEDHLFASMRVFAIAEWYKEFDQRHPLKIKNFSKLGV